MAELDAWKPGMPRPEHSIEEHLRAAKLAIHDVGARVNRVWLHLALWLLAWLCLIGLGVWAAILWLR